MTDVIDLSDDDDCVQECVTFEQASGCDKRHSDLYYEVCKTNQYLADFIEKCLSLENDEMMLKILKNKLLTEYFGVEKSVRESPRIQKALRRANNLLNTNPELKFTHINDLCEILKASKVKKKVPFITLTTDLKDRKCEEHSLKRCNSVQINATNCKKTKLDNNHPSENTSPFSETAVSVNFNDTTSTLGESTAIENCSQEHNTPEDSFLVPQDDVHVDPVSLNNEERIKKLERKLAYYKKEIARLDELEVHDDSVNSPYIKSERLKSALVVVYKELCQLTGSQPVKRKEIRLQVVAGHPPGPTRILETFLNDNIGSDGQPPFPDFCDVVNCVTEANEKDDLGWTKCQIMKEACMLFTQCGRALQKRRQNREYQDLLCKVKLEDCQRDPADDDHELMAKLQENKRIAMKKESEILERYVMMESLPPRLKSKKSGTIIKNTENGISDHTIENNSPLTAINHNNNSIVNITPDVDIAPLQEFKSNININDQNITQDERNNINNKDENAIDIVDKKSHEEDNIENKKSIQETRHNVDKENEEIMNYVHKEIPDENDSDKIRPNSSIEITNIELIDTGSRNDNHGNEMSLDVNNHVKSNSIIQSNSVTHNQNIKDIESNAADILSNEFIGRAIKQEPEEELTTMIKNLGDSFTVIIENIEEPTITIEISSDSSDDEMDE